MSGMAFPEGLTPEGMAAEMREAYAAGGLSDYIEGVLSAARDDGDVAELYAALLLAAPPPWNRDGEAAAGALRDQGHGLR